MKTCTNCNQCQELDNFAFKNKAKGTRQSWCKVCQRAYAKSDYLAKTDYYKAKNAISRSTIIKRNKNFINGYLKTHPCVECGETDIEILQFDHVEMLLKRGGRVPNFITGSLEKLIIEIEKCEVRCVKCHTRRTRKQMGWQR